MIVVTGATGRVGGAAVRTLLAGGHAVRALARDPARVAAGLRQAEIVAADLNDPESLRHALASATTALLVCANSRHQQHYESNFVAAAIEAGVERIVKISAMESAADASPIPAAHYQVEQQIRASELSWTFLRPNFFMQNLLLAARSLAASDTFALPFGDAEVAPVDTDDIGAAAAAILTDGDHAGEVYELSGETCMTFAEVAQSMSQALDREIHYVDQPPDAFRALMNQLLPDEWHVDALCALFAEIRSGKLATSNARLRTLLGRAPTTVADFTTRFSRAFTAA